MASLETLITYARLHICTCGALNTEASVTIGGSSATGLRSAVVRQIDRGIADDGRLRQVVICFPAFPFSKRVKSAVGTGLHTRSIWIKYLYQTAVIRNNK